MLMRDDMELGGGRGFFAAEAIPAGVLLLAEVQYSILLLLQFMTPYAFADTMGDVASNMELK